MPANRLLTVLVGVCTTIAVAAAPAGAACFDVAALAPVAAAAARALAVSDELMVTLWPARTDDDAIALPTLPPPMIAIFIPVSLDLCL